ncbi:MAG: malonate transporter subunit MadL, partial [Bacteroidota bacterium]
MVIYGIGLLAFCFLVGQFIGESLGRLLGIEANVGGVGFSMILLMICTDGLQKRGLLPVPTEQGILFWSTMYIPIIIAMSATQNVFAALSQGFLALLVGILPTLLLFLC